jgi:hypothetical protein
MQINDLSVGERAGARKGALSVGHTVDEVRTGASTPGCRLPLLPWK